MISRSIHYVGVAGWGLPTAQKKDFETEGSNLQCYSKVFNCVEINSSFYREHQFSTYQRWGESVPHDFRFSVKLSQVFTHQLRLQVRERDLAKSLENLYGLEEKLKVILVQLPPSLEYDSKAAEDFFIKLRKYFDQTIVLEARNLSWINRSAFTMMQDLGISKVLADPEKCPGGSEVFETGDLAYFRYHGSPIIYRSSYSQDQLKSLALSAKSFRQSWCIFDNTTLGAGTLNALELKKIIQ